MRSESVDDQWLRAARKAVATFNSEVTGKPEAQCNISSYQNQVLSDELPDNVRTAVGSRREEALALGLGLCQVFDARVRFPKPLVDAAAISAKKGKDYNAAVGRSAYFPLGMASYAQMIHTKAMRLVNLSKTSAEPNFESVRDTCLDLINYACFLAEALESGELS